MSLGYVDVWKLIAYRSGEDKRMSFSDSTWTFMDSSNMLFAVSTYSEHMHVSFTLLRMFLIEAIFPSQYIALLLWGIFTLALRFLFEISHLKISFNVAKG